ncbi:ABC transporter ATP-binding protein [Salinarchaeum sp. Harcht-Bsk1]|uniref:ABC transporter ATP-binding protein n=1 Tax=Salinarchaeum sp. Harcht-Bsk1 TaxID=1333523 RepID=UPI000677AB24|nr:ABC transporter ATP-binding protein [Salinarchaeum sp. Harcht-Bsk1]
MSGATAPVIEVEDLQKRYGDLTAVDDVSFAIQADEVFALVGPNGAGKTTIVEILECLRTPTAGTATVLGHDVRSDTQAIKDAIGVVPQSFHTFDRLSVRENVALTRRMYDDGRDVDDVLDELDLDDYADTRFESLSGGYQRRTGIAMALVSDPEVLFLDEPTTGLDPAARRSTWRQIESLAAAGTTVVLTTHYMEEVEELADRAALLLDGTIEAVDTVQNLIATYGGDVKLVVGAGAGEDAAIESILESTATEVYRNETDDFVALYEDRAVAQTAFGDVLDVNGERSIDLTTAGMDDVFLRLAGAPVEVVGDGTATGGDDR